MALSAIAAQQAQATVAMEQAVNLLIDYVATYPNDGFVYQAPSDMILCAHADAGFLNKSQSYSQAGAHIFLLENNPFLRFNGAMLSIAQSSHLLWLMQLNLNLLHSLSQPAR